MRKWIVTWRSVGSSDDRAHVPTADDRAFDHHVRLALPCRSVAEWHLPQGRSLEEPPLASRLVGARQWRVGAPGPRRWSSVPQWQRHRVVICQPISEGKAQGNASCREQGVERQAFLLPRKSRRGRPAPGASKRTWCRNPPAPRLEARQTRASHKARFTYVLHQAREPSVRPRER